MNKFSIFLLLAIFSVYSYEYHTNICAGLSLAVGDGSSYMRPGPGLSFEPNIKVNQYFGIGGHVDYSWMTVDFDELYYGEGYRAGDHFIDIGFVPKLYVNLHEHSSMFFEVDPAIAMDIGYVSEEYGGDRDSHTEAELAFAMTYGFGFVLKQFVFGFKFKHIVHDYIEAKWVNFYLGYSGS